MRYLIVCLLTILLASCRAQSSQDVAMTIPDPIQAQSMGQLDIGEITAFINETETHEWQVNTEVGDELQVVATLEESNGELMIEIVGDDTTIKKFSPINWIADGGTYTVRVLSRYGAGDYRLQLTLLNPTPTPPPPTPSPTQANEPELGTGDVQITLRWTGNGDMDLHVIDPRQERIYFADPSSTSGGELDVDVIPCDNNIAQVENIFWSAGNAPRGAYQVQLHYHPSCGAQGSQNYQVTVLVDGETRTFDGTASTVDEYIDIYNFNR